MLDLQGVLVLFVIACSFGFTHGSGYFAHCKDYYDCKKCDDIKRSGQCSANIAYCAMTCNPNCAFNYVDDPNENCAEIKSKGKCFEAKGFYLPVWATVCQKSCCVPDKPPHWSEWSSWTPCSKSCKYGLTSRSRKCQGEAFGQTCKGSPHELKKCNENVPCEGLIGWDDSSVDIDECAGTVSVKITRTRVINCAASITVNTNDGSATQPADYNQIKDLVITFDKNETVKSVTFKINGDTDIEGPESFSAVITADPKKLEITESKCTVNIKDQSAKIGFKPDSYTVSENDKKVKVTVHRFGNKNGKNTCSVSSADVTAKSPDDYKGITKVPVVFNAGDDTKEIEIPIEDDNIEEKDEAFKMSLACEESPCTKVVPDEALVTIKSDDVDGQWGEWGEYGDCSKSCGTGSQSRSRSCNNPAPQGEGAYCVGTNTSSQDCNTHHCPGKVGWDQITAELDECEGTVTVKIVRSETTNIPASIKVDLNPGTASADDYYPLDQPTIQFDKDATEVTVTFKAKSDNTIEPDETFTAVITPTNAADLTVADGKGTCTLTIKDQSAGISFEKVKYTVSENDKLTVNVVRNGNSQGANTCRVKSFKTDGDNAAEAPADYAAVDQKIVFEENKNSIPVNIVIVDDAKQESTENFGLMLTCEKPDCVKVNKANVEITDDDIDGQWGEWGQYGDCSKSCGTGSQSRSRSCNNPAPQGEGAYCVGTNTSSQDCNTHHCPGKVGWDQITAELDECEGTVTVKIVRSETTNIPASIKVDLNPGTATADDYYPLDQPTIQFVKGETEVTVTFKAKSDNTIEPDETFTAVITPTNAADLTVVDGKGTCTLTIKDQSAIFTFQKQKYSFPENNGTVNVVVKRSGNSNGKNVCSLKSSDGTAEAGKDYEAIDVPVVFESRDSSQSVSVEIIDDTEDENDNESFKLVLECENPKCVRPCDVEVEIKDDDVDGQWGEWGQYGDCSKSCGTGSQSRSRSCNNPAPEGEGAYCVGTNTSSKACNTQQCTAKVGLKPAYQTVPENVEKVKVNVFRIGNSEGTNRVNISTKPKSATSPDDFESIPVKELTFNPDESNKMVEIQIKNDCLPENDEEFEVILTSDDSGVVSVSPDAAIIKVLDDDVVLGLDPTAKSVRESDGSVKFTVFRKGHIRGKSTAIINTCETGSATASEDFEPLTNFKVEFAEKEKEKTFDIKIINDKKCEPDESFCVKLTSSDKNVCNISPKKAEITIVEDDVKLSLHPGKIRVLESKKFVKLTVKRFGNLKGTTNAVINTNDITALAGKDYKPRTGFKLKFKPKQSVKHFKVFLMDDNIPEDTETFDVKLTSPDKDVTVVNPDSSVIKILDHDAKIGFKDVKYYFKETAGVVTVVLVRTCSDLALKISHSVTVTSVDDSAIQPDDYKKVKKRIIFKAGQKTAEVKIKIKNDNIQEGKETFKLKLTTTDIRVQLEPEMSTVCIKDNDVDGKWGPWSNFSPCGKTCGTSTKYRTRKCDDPPQAGEGKHCEGKDRQEESCYVREYCRVDGGFSEWSKWSECSLSCGNGTKMRSRKCDNPAPKYGGLPCLGSSHEVKPCVVNSCCKVDGQWGSWSKWSACSKTCVNDLKEGGGERTRTRECNYPKPSCGGADCQPGPYSKVGATEKTSCSVVLCSNAYVVAPMNSGYGSQPTTKPTTAAPTTQPAYNPYGWWPPAAYDENENEE